LRFLTRLGQRPAMHLHRNVGAEAERLRATLLLENDLFKGLGPDEMVEIAEKLPMATCRAGQVIYEPGETGEALFILKSGHVRLYRIAPDGRKLVLATLGSGTAFGDMSVLGQSMIGSFAEATEECTICIMSRVDIEQIILEHPRVAIRMVELLSGRLRDVENRLEQMAFAPVPSRLAQLLIDLEHDSEVAGHSHQDLAEMIGTSRETVSRALVEFKATGWVEIDRRCIRIVNREAIEEFAASGS
jgi:CRP/FNR family cyclic AMP-dependent transcriptional regulator